MAGERERYERNLDEAEEHALLIAEDLLDQPLSRRFTLRSLSTGDNRVYTAEDVLGERAMRLATYIAIAKKAPEMMICPVRDGVTELRMILGVSQLALNATPYLWTEEVRQVVRDVELPRHVLSPSMLPTPRGWHTFETGIGVGGTFVHNGRRCVNETIDAVLVADTSEGFQVFQFGEMRDAETDEKVPTIFGAHIPYGLTYPDDFEDKPWRVLAESIMTLLTFLNSPYIPKEQRRVGRGARREAQRMGKPIEDDLVTFIILRRPETKKRKTDEEQSVDWKHRWLVNGHVRAQWYPTEQAHRLIWIAPYLKGPEDAPMLTHAYKVAR